MWYDFMTYEKISEVFRRHGFEPWRLDIFNLPINYKPSLKKPLLDLKDFDHVEIFNFISDHLDFELEDAMRIRNRGIVRFTKQQNDKFEISYKIQHKELLIGIMSWVSENVINQNSNPQFLEFSEKL